MSEEKQISLTEALKTAKEPEDQLKVALDFMRLALNQEGSPRLRDFWDAKAACLPLFKGRISPTARTYFWDEFIELSNEARKLKEVLDEQSVFASEQIDLAIQALESDLCRFDEMLGQMKSLDLSKEAVELLSDVDFYNAHFKELSLLTSLSSRIGSLKQEVIKTSMRVRQKGRIFEKLHQLREQILPRRKKIIEALGTAFVSDVEAMIKRHGNKPCKPFYALREEIKTMQELSKTLNISTDAFIKTREMLSQFWDNIRLLDKDRKKVLGEKKQFQKENLGAVTAKLDAFERELESLSKDEAKKRTAEIYSYMRELDLHRDSVVQLKTRLKNLEQTKTTPKPEEEPIQPKVDTDLMQVEKAIVALQESSSAETQDKIEAMDIEKTDPMLDPLHDLLLEQKQGELLAKEEVLVSEVEELINERAMQKKRIQERLETLRKTAGAYSLDFERSMQIDEEIKAKKILVKKIESAIKELYELIN
ncbi:MAG TPA: hypothetical protein PLO43_02665 [Chlamydiales bacterium]|nr:hypothetical protein [Chlamydiales bacterium]